MRHTRANLIPIGSPPTEAARNSPSKFVAYRAILGALLQFACIVRVTYTKAQLLALNGVLGLG